VASLFEGEKHSAAAADARRVQYRNALQLTIAQSEKELVITLHRTKRRTV
jgi:hypothetical protein